MAKIAFLGLGVMGYPMAGHIASAGHEVTVYNRTAAKAEAWVAQHGGAHAATPAAAAADERDRRGGGGGAGQEGAAAAARAVL